MYLVGKTSALILASTSTLALTAAVVPMPAIAAEVRAAASGTAVPRPPRPDRHHFAPTTAAAALVPTSPLRIARAAGEANGATV